MFDLIVIGGGHAGIEAAHIASKFKLNIALITMPDVGLASAPCNPCIGGVGKGQVVRELDALGALTPILADKTGIQFRTLNESKGFAVQSTRVQIDKELYSQEAEKEIDKNEFIQVIRQKVSSVKSLNGIFLVKCHNQQQFEAKKIIMTVGTFLGGKLHTGEDVKSGGRVGCEAAESLTEIFSEIKKAPNRFKTGTPPRILASSVDYSKCEEQASDSETLNFHWAHSENQARFSKQVSCYLTRTTDKTMNIIRENKERSPMYNGQIKAIGARYCPSIEDKAYRYPDKQIHHVFIEPEGLNLPTVYPSGISSSLPREVQDEYVRTIPGLEKSLIKTYGYAVEYDVIDTTELKQTLEHKSFKGLYFAGQVNGTSGYEEAAGQGYIAGINAALALVNRPEFILSRHDSYIGVMIEDLVSNLRDEPYRLFTARSENRLYIREDNAILRMYPYRRLLNLNEELDFYIDKFLSFFHIFSTLLDETFVNPDECPYRDIDGLERLRRMSISELLKQSWINPVDVLSKILSYYQIVIPKPLLRTLAITKKYEGYIERSNGQLERMNKLDNRKIDWQEVCQSSNISFECKQRITMIRPETFGQLKRIEGIRPATLAVVAGRAL